MARARATAIRPRLQPPAANEVTHTRFLVSAERLFCVHGYEGTINQFLGDGFMALFGAPVAVEDHARRGALAALGIHKGIQQLRTEVGLYDEMALSIRIGMNTGLVVVGSFPVLLLGLEALEGRDVAAGVADRYRQQSQGTGHVVETRPNPHGERCSRGIGHRGRLPATPRGLPCDASEQLV